MVESKFRYFMRGSVSICCCFRDKLYLDKRAVKRFRGCVSIFILGVVYSSLLFVNGSNVERWWTIAE